MSLNSLVSSTGWKNFIAKLYGFGASIVIIGALFKIQHWPMAGLMLTIGLLTEAVIFFFSAFEPLHEEIDWTLVYPELAGIPTEGGTDRHHGSVAAQAAAPSVTAGVASVVSGAVASGVTAGIGGNIVYSGGGSIGAMSKFDEMLESAEITPDLLKNLGSGMKKLSETTANMKAMGDVTAASTKYMETINTANDSLGNLAVTYKSATEALNNSSTNYQSIADSISKIDAGGKSYQQQIESLNKNLAALNTVYELQKKGADNHIKEYDALYQGVQGLVKNLNDSAEDTKKYRDQVAKLNDNLGALNNVYGNMLSAMNVK